MVGEMIFWKKSEEQTPLIHVGHYQLQNIYRFKFVYLVVHQTLKSVALLDSSGLYRYTMYTNKWYGVIEQRPLY